MNNKSLFFAAGVAGVAAGLGSSIPLLNLLNCLLCGWLWIGGAFAVMLYNKRESTSLEAGQGALVGAASGLVAAVVAMVVGFAFTALGIGVQAAIDPQMAEDYLGGLAVTGIMQTLGLFFNLIVYPLFGALGGLIGASIFKKK